MLAVYSVQNLCPITSSMIYTITILCFFTLVCNSVSHCKRNLKFTMFATLVLKRTFCYKSCKETGHWTELQNGKFHNGTEASVGTLCINSKITIYVTRITFITFLLIKFLSHYMFQLELTHLQSIPFHWKHTTYYHIQFSSIQNF
jgi:hypothetical protein